MLQEIPEVDKSQWIKPGFEPGEDELAPFYSLAIKRFFKQLFKKSKGIAYSIYNTDINFNKSAENRLVIDAIRLGDYEIENLRIEGDALCPDIYFKTQGIEFHITGDAAEAITEIAAQEISRKKKDDLH